MTRKDRDRMTREDRDRIRACIRSEVTQEQKESLVHAPSQKVVLEEIRLILESWNVPMQSE